MKLLYILACTLSLAFIQPILSSGDYLIKKRIIDTQAEEAAIAKASINVYKLAIAYAQEKLDEINRERLQTSIPERVILEQNKQINAFRKIIFDAENHILALEGKPVLQRFLKLLPTN
jgi:hypothetical protein